MGTSKVSSCLVGQTGKGFLSQRLWKLCLSKIHQLIKNHTEEKSYSDTGGDYFALILNKNFKRLLSHAAYRKKEF